MWPDMRDVVGLFMALQTQWRWISAGMGGAFRSGIDYPAIAPTASALGLTMTPGLFNDLRLLEAEALRVWNGKR